ncbi:MAG: O-antigen ligase family protein [Clostridia bacterium]|nr:O-antigen ligase family protein [Clostridia bacterium]
MDAQKKRHDHAPRKPIAAFFAFLAALPVRFSSWLADTFLGRLFHAYDKSCGLLAESRLARRFRESRVYRMAAPLRYRTARLLTDNALTKTGKSLLSTLRYTTTRTYGVLFGTFGIYTILVYAIQHFFFSGTQGEKSVLFTGIAVSILSLLLLLSGKPLCYDLQESRLLGYLLYRVVGLRRHQLVKKGARPMSPAVGFLLGSLLGIAAFFFHPLYILGIIFAVSLFFLLLFSPELCLFSSLLLAPFFIFFERPSVLLCAIVLIGVVGYLLKILLGKRLFSFGPVDFSVLFLMGGYLLLSFFTYGGAASSARALMCAVLMGGYFLAVNLLTSPALINRAVNALLTSGTAVALIGLVQQFTGNAIADWLDSAAFDYISGRITSVFENPNILSVYLILLFPFAVARLLQKASPLRYAGNLLVFCIFMAAIVYTWSRGAWIGVITALVVFLFAVNPATVYLLIPVGVGTPLLLKFASSPIAERLASANLGDSSISYRFGIWQGAWRMIGDHFFGGIGAGESAFTAVYPYYALSGIEAATHTHSLYMQYLVEFGIAGLVLFLLFVFLFYQCAFTHWRDEENEKLRLTAIAAGCGILAVLINGFADHVFYNSRIFFLFFAVAGIAVALSRVGKTVEERSKPLYDEGNETFSLDVDFS